MLKTAFVTHENKRADQKRTEDENARTKRTRELWNKPVKRIVEGNEENKKRVRKESMAREKRREKKEQGVSRTLCHLRCGDSLAYYMTELVLFFLFVSLFIFLSSLFNSLAFSSDGENFVPDADSFEFSWILSCLGHWESAAMPSNITKEKDNIKIERERERIDTHT